MDFLDERGEKMPPGTIGVTIIYDHIRNALDGGYTCILEQGGTRSSKTVTTAITLVELCVTQKIKICVLRKTFPILRMSVLQDFFDVVKQMNLYNKRNWSNLTHCYTFPKTGSEVWFVAADESEKMKGLKADIMWLNEATEMTVDDYHQLRFRSKVCIMDFNPNFPQNHWIVSEFPVQVIDAMTPKSDGVIPPLPPEQMRKKNYFFISTYKDNPYLSPEQIEYIESLRLANPSLYKMFGEGRRCVLQGRIFGNVEHIDDAPTDRHIRWYAGIDYGYSVNPTAIVKVGIDEHSKHIYIEEIAYKVDLRPDAIRDILQKDPRIAGLQIVADSANPQMNLLVEEPEKGKKVLRITRVDKGGQNSRMVRIESVQMMLVYKIVIVGESDNVKNEFESYVYKTDQDGSFTNEPVSFNDHSIDAARYVFMMRHKVKRHGGGVGRRCGIVMRRGGR